jgi:hypothetical protein
LRSVMRSCRTTAGMSAPVAALRRAKVVPLTPVTFSVSSAVMLLVRLIRVVFTPGVNTLMVGRGPVRNVQMAGVSGLPAVSMMPEVRVRVYFLSAVRVGVGFSVATLVAAL